MTDSTTSEGSWLRKTNFIEGGESVIQATIRIEVARLHATHYLENEIREYSQWSVVPRGGQPGRRRPLPGRRPLG